MTTLKQLRQRLGDLNRVEGTLQKEGARVLLDQLVRARAVVHPPIRIPASRWAPSDLVALKQHIDTGITGLRKLQTEGDATELTAEEEVGVEVIILLVSRPALFINDGEFCPPPLLWRSILEQERESIRRICPSVGCIEVAFEAGPPEMRGTGFLVAPDVVMTNRHVVKGFGRFHEGRWRFNPGHTPFIDFRGEQHSRTKDARAILEIIGVHDDPEVDLALLRIPPHAERGDPRLHPLTLASKAPDPPEHRPIYVIGYPASDNQGITPRQVLEDIFGSVYQVKRLQPGELMKIDTTRPVFTHDCSTLGGNSGSCVVDIQTSQVIGLHYRGIYLQDNAAVALWRLKDDPLLTRNGVRFAGIHP